MVTTILGGIGLFLLGMVLLTDSLKTAAGGALRSVLGRFTGGTARAIASGAALTALVQSSSATVLTTIGFVSAGLLTLRQATGVIFGAAIGTTSTGWLVSLLGLKLSIGAVALPLVGVGALMHLLARNRAGAIGLAIAGFGVIFVGIDVLQQGMTSLGQRLDPADLPPAGIGGRLVLVLVGAGMTIVMQSSSAAVATTLTALHSGAITLEHAAALVVGQNIGTSATAGLAAIGASVPARRTAVAHILLNTGTGVIAFFLVPLFVRAEPALAAAVGADEHAVMVAAFHTAFTILGVLVFAPAIGPFTRLLERLVPERAGTLTRNLDPSVAELPQVAVEAARRTVMRTAEVAVGILASALRDPRRGSLPADRLAAAGDALRETRHFLGRVRTSAEADEHARHLSVHHALDHLGRLLERLQHHTPEDGATHPVFDELRGRAHALMPAVLLWLKEDNGEPPVNALHELADDVADRRRDERERTLARTAGGELDPDVADARLAAMRWLDSSLYHVWRMTHHLAAPDPVAAAESPAP
jgi:phosphate:Na+ symporter